MDIAGIDNQAILQELNARKETKDTGSGEQEFLKLLVAQLQNQNPLDPQQSGEFLAQLAQFSTVEGIEKLNLSFNNFASDMLSNQALQATALVGRSVQIPSNIGTLNNGEALTGSVNLPASTSGLNLGIYDQNGALVRSLQLGAHASGQVNFSWDGLSNQGNFMPPGLYQVRAEANIGEDTQEVEAFVNANVNSVTTSNTGNILLNLEGGLGTLALNDVIQIN